MCTVTYLPLSGNDFILTSSRDVPFKRKKADAPKIYIEDDVEITYPKDGDAGGTWIGTSSKNRLICLLNGGFEKHTSKKKYRLSRGLIVKELLKTDAISEELNAINLNDIEPFTLVIVDWNNGLKLIEFVWTGLQKHLTNMQQTQGIWSSSTLYENTTKRKREVWFKEWQSDTKDINQNNIIQFHKTAGEGDDKTNVLMKRDGGGTVSITSIKRQNNELYFIYEDVLTHKTTIL